MSSCNELDDRRFGALTQLREAKLAAGQRAFQKLTDQLMRTIAEGRLTQTELETLVPFSVAKYVPEILVVMEAAERAGEAVAAAPYGWPAPEGPVGYPSVPMSGGPAGYRGASAPAPHAPLPVSSPTQELAISSAMHTEPDGDRLVGLLDIDPRKFAPFDPFGTGETEEPERLTTHRDDHDQVILEWFNDDDDGESDLSPGSGQPQGADGPIVLFRLVSSDDYLPVGPDEGVVCVTRGTEYVDGRPFTTAVRHYQVWRNEGSTLKRALRAQPVLTAQASVVTSVRNAKIRADHGQVIGSWEAAPGVAAVRVLRTSRGRASRVDWETEILGDQRNLMGFADPDIVEGKAYTYQVLAEVEIEDLEGNPTRVLSAPVLLHVVPLAIPKPASSVEVKPLYAIREGQQQVFDVSWNPPSVGEVVIYRVTTAPREDIHREAVPLGSLASAGLEESLRVSHPPMELDDGRIGMKSVPWPNDWPRGFVVPVTVLGDQVFVAHPVPIIRSTKVSNPRLIERCNMELLTFEWPEGASAVRVQKGALDGDVWESAPSLELPREQYEREGGLVFPEQLPNRGCSIHMRAISFYGGESHRGEPVILQYPGLARMQYNLRSGGIARVLGVGALKRTLTIESQMELLHPPPFVLVWKAGALPLAATEPGCTPLPVTVAGDELTEPTFNIQPPALGPSAPQTIWVVNLDSIPKGVRSNVYLRLFVAVEADILSRFALLDPPVSDLKVK